jgi:hypothetical protein
MEVFKAIIEKKQSKKLANKLLQESLNRSYLLKVLRKQSMEVLKGAFIDNVTAVVIDIRQDRVNDFLTLRSELSKYYNINQIDQTKFMVRPIMIEIGDF